MTAEWDTGATTGKIVAPVRTAVYAARPSFTAGKSTGVANAMLT